MLDAVLKRLDDTDWQVRQQLAASLGALPQGPRETALTSMLEKHASDPIALDAALSGLRGAEVTVLENFLQRTTSTPPAETAITMLAATIVRGAQDAPAQELFQRVAEKSRPEWQRAALLRGAEVALLGAAMPGTPAGRGGRGGAGAAGGGNVPATAPGQRGGPGGAPAFPRAGGAAAGGAAAAEEGAPGGRGGRGGGGRGGGGGALRLNREPALSALANTPDEIGKRAAALLARIEWPGKPGVAAPVTPLTPAEQARFDAGRTVYQSLCQACHQPDGRGLERIAPTLLGSRLDVGSCGNSH